MCFTIRNFTLRTRLWNGFNSYVDVPLYLDLERRYLGLNNTFYIIAIIIFFVHTIHSNQDSTDSTRALWVCDCFDSGLHTHVFVISCSKVALLLTNISVFKTIKTWHKKKPYKIGFQLARIKFQIFGLKKTNKQTESQRSIKVPLRSCKPQSWVFSFNLINWFAMSINCEVTNTASPTSTLSFQDAT